MQLKISTLKRISFIAAIIIIGTFIYILFGSNHAQNIKQPDSLKITPTIENGKQILDLTAKWGYSPEIMQAQADIPSILKVNTNTTFDCSAALTIPKLGISKNLPPSGTTEIEIPAQKAGTVINGSCSMGMYGFKIKFS